MSTDVVFPVGTLRVSNLFCIRGACVSEELNLNLSFKLLLCIEVEIKVGTQGRR